MNGAISETNYWNTYSIPIFVGCKKQVNLFFTDVILFAEILPLFSEIQMGFQILLNPLYIGFTITGISMNKLCTFSEWRNKLEIKRYMHHISNAVSALFCASSCCSQQVYQMVEIRHVYPDRDACNEK